MKGKRALVILGAGASACYVGGERKLPTQKDIINSFVFPKISRSSPNIRLGGFISDIGLTFSLFLADYLCKKFNLKDRDENLLTEFWIRLSEKGLNLESLYDELEKDATSEGLRATNDFISILMAKIRQGVGSRSKDNLCRYHVQLVKNLEPSDYIITFNWDTLIDDALLYECPFWYPYTGYGISIVGLQGDFLNKVFEISSLVHLFHLHGSIGLYEPIDEKYKGGIVVVGKRGLCPNYELIDLLGMKKEVEEMQKKGISGQPTPKRKITDEEQAFLDRGCFRFGKRKKIWFRPVFITPSKAKPEYKSWYASSLRRIIHSKLPLTKEIIIAGYSFPPADFHHLQSFFVPEIIPEEILITCINFENGEEEFRKKVKQIFPKNNIDFSVKDFKEYCNSLPLK